MLKEKLYLYSSPSSLQDCTSKSTVETIYNYWRIRTFYSIYVGYIFYYFTRKSFIFTIPFLNSELDLSKADIGLLGTILTTTYGISKFINGIFSDRYNPRYLMAIGLILSGICNILFGCSTSLLFLGIFWGLNGWFQGYGWPASTKQLMYWYSNSERAKWWSIFTTSITIGGFLIAHIAGRCANFYGWQYGVIIPGILCVIIGFWLLNRLRGIPETLGLPIIEHFKEEPIKEEDLHKLPIKEILKSTLYNKHIWLIAIASFFIYAIRTAIYDWGTLYLLEEKGYEPIMATSSIAWFEAGCFIGILVSGWVSDNWFSGKRLPLMVISSFFLFFVLIGLWCLVSENFIFITSIIGLCGLLISIPQVLLEIASTEFVSKKVASTANGFAGWFAYCGAATAGYPLGKITEIYGWGGFFIVVGSFALVNLCTLLPILFAESKAS